MDADNLIHVTENGAGFENGIHEEFLPSEEQVAIDKVNGVPCCSLEIEGLSADIEDGMKLNDSEDVDPSGLVVTAGSPMAADGNAADNSQVGNIISLFFFLELLNSACVIWFN